MLVMLSPESATGGGDPTKSHYLNLYCISRGDEGVEDTIAILTLILIDTD